MNKTHLIFMAALAVSGTAISQQTAVGPREQAPSIRNSSKPVAVKPPDERHRVAVLNIELEMDKGKVLSSRVLKATRARSIAPKVFARQGGDWAVRINGSKRDRFFVFNPGYREAETAENAAKPHTWVATSGLVDWRLVIPLYRGERQIDARFIEVIDQRTQSVVLRAEF